jgi:hypothetical protein
VVTRVTAGGVVKTFMVDTLVGNETTGFTWTRRAVGVRPAQKATPVVARSVAQPGEILGTVREGVCVAPQREEPTTAVEVGVVSGVVDVAVSEPDIPASSLGESITSPTNRAKCPLGADRNSQPSSPPLFCQRRTGCMRRSGRPSRHS